MELLLAAADLIQQHVPEANTPASGNEVSKDVVGVRQLLEQMSENIATHLSAMNTKMDSLAERVQTVENEPSPRLSTPPSSSSLTLDYPRHWADQEHKATFNPDEVLIWPNDDPELSEADGNQGCQLHQDHTTSGGNPAAAWTAAHYIHRQYPCDGRVTAEGPRYKGWYSSWRTRGLS